MGAMLLKERVKEAVDAAADKGLTVAQLAKKIGVHKNAIYQWLDGTTKNLKHDHLFGLARASGLSVEWLATEKGTKRDVKPLAGADAVDLSFLTDTIQAVEEYLDQQDLELNPEAKARLVTLLYEKCAQEGKVEQPAVARYLRLVA